MDKKKENNDLMGKIPNHFTFLGIILSILSMCAIAFAFKVLFL